MCIQCSSKYCVIAAFASLRNGVKYIRFPMLSLLFPKALRNRFPVYSAIHPPAETDGEILGERKLDMLELSTRRSGPRNAPQHNCPSDLNAVVILFISQFPRLNSPACKKTAQPSPLVNENSHSRSITDTSTVSRKRDNCRRRTRESDDLLVVSSPSASQKKWEKN